MSFRPGDFADDTDFERLVLDRLGTHRVRLPEPGSVHDIRGRPVGAIISVSGTLASGTRARDRLRLSLHPLGFGAAYKILDMLVEHVLRATGARYRLTFKKKQRVLGQRPAMLPAPLDTHPELWDRLAVLYSNLQEARHAVTHRRALATPTGDLEIYNDARRVIDTVTSSEIADFAAAVHAVAEAIIEASDDERRVGIVAHHLNALGARHQLPALPSIDTEAGRSDLLADLIELDDGRLRFDVARARDAVQGQAAGTVWNLELHAGGRIFVGRWEHVPDRHTAHDVEFHPASPPSWLTEELPEAS